MIFLHVLSAFIIEAEHTKDFIQNSLYLLVGSIVGIRDDTSGALERKLVVDLLHDAVVFAAAENSDEPGSVDSALLLIEGRERNIITALTDVEPILNGVMNHLIALAILCPFKGVAFPLVVNAELRNDLGILIGLFSIRSDLKGDGSALLEDIGRSKRLLDLGASQGLVVIGLVIGSENGLHLDILQVGGLNLDLSLIVGHVSLHVLAEVRLSGDGHGHDSVNLGARDDGVGLLKNSIAGAAIPGGVGGLLSGKSLDLQAEVLELDFFDLDIPTRRESGGCDSEDHDESDCESQNLLHFFVSLSTVFLQVSRERFPRQ